MSRGWAGSSGSGGIPSHHVIHWSVQELAKAGRALGGGPGAQNSMLRGRSPEPEGGPREESWQL